MKYNLEYFVLIIALFCNNDEFIMPLKRNSFHAQMSVGSSFSVFFFFDVFWNLVGLTKTRCCAIYYWVYFAWIAIVSSVSNCLVEIIALNGLGINEEVLGFMYIFHTLDIINLLVWFFFFFYFFRSINDAISIILNALFIQREWINSWIVLQCH